MKSVTIYRGPSSDEGTFGRLVTDDGALSLRTLELPWRDNARGHSCIPLGSYVAVWHKSPSKGWVYLLQGTAPRTDVLIHSANFAGETEKGFKSEVLGCIALGYAIGQLDNGRGHLQRALVRNAQGLGSRDACKTFYAWGDSESLGIHIIQDEAHA